MNRDLLAKMVGQNIATERRARRHTQAWLAPKAQITREMLSRYENGREVAPLLTLVRISDALHCPLTALLRGLVAEEVPA